MKPIPVENLQLSAIQRQRLDTAYRKAEYLVTVGSDTLVFGIGHYDARAEAALRQQIPIHREWAILTPCNPRSQEATQEMNGFYYHELRDVLAARNSLWIAAINHDPLGSWQDEPGFLIADADPLWVRDLGARFRQNAYVAARIGEPLRLIWLA